MGKGLIRISPALIQDSLQFPADWKIEHMETEVSPGGHTYFVAVISGDGFPETARGEEIKECMIDITKEQITFKVRVM